MTNLYLTPVDDEGKIIYNSKNNSQNADFCSLTGSILIRKMRISASIFSPPVIDVYCLSDELEQNKSTPLHSTFGIVMEEIETHKTDSGEETENHLTCLISNREDVFTQFAIAAIDKCGSNILCITLMEKHALTLALTHSFFSIGNSSNAIFVGGGRFSVAEIVESLSTIPENSEASDEDEESKQRNIFNFESSRLYGYNDYIGIGDDGAFSAQLANYAVESCAFLSRFVAPASQSRLEIISSLMFKYGYGFVYRPDKKQYFAIDLLSMIAPGYKSGKTVVSFIDKNNFSLFGNEPDYLHDYDYDFVNFFQKHFLPYYDSSGFPRIYYSTLGSRDYCYLSRYVPLCSLPCTAQIDNGFCNKYPFDLSLFSKAQLQDTSSASDNSTQALLFQNKCHTEQEGASNCFFEDEVEIKDTLDEGRYAANSGIKTVNQRLAYARYKLDYMQKNHIGQGFEFKDNDGISRNLNLVYELFQWLGFHTDMFKTIADFYKLTIRENNQPKFSGATHSIIPDYTELDKEHENYNLNCFAKRFKGDYDFLHNFKDKNTSSIFGRLDMEISTNYKDDKIIYDLVSYLTFYNDIIDYNIDPFSWNSQTSADIQNQLEEEQSNNEWENSDKQSLSIDDLLEGGRRLSKDPQ